MGKLIRALARSQEQEAKRQQQLMEANQGKEGGALDPSKLDFCRVMYDYTPANEGNTEGIDLAVKKGDLVAVLSKTDPMGSPSEWWRCRARDGRVGYLPSPYLEAIQRKTPQAIMGKSQSQPGSRTGTLTSSIGGGSGGSGTSRAQTLTEKSNINLPTKPEVKGGAADISPESFQKSQFYT